VFSDKTARAVRSLSERNEIPSNYQKCPGASGLATWPRSCWRFDVESHRLPASNAAEWSGRIRSE
jgi:hypothetical protein